MHTVLNAIGVWFSLMWNPKQVFWSARPPPSSNDSGTQWLRLLPFCGFTRINKDLWINKDRCHIIQSRKRKIWNIIFVSLSVQAFKWPKLLFSYFIGYNSVTWWYSTVGDAGKCSLLCVLEGEETGLVNSWPVFTTDSFNAILLFQQLNDLHCFASLQGDSRSYYL